MIEEAIRSAIKQRSFLFERLINDKMPTDNDKSGDSDDEEEVDTGDVGV